MSQENNAAIEKLAEAITRLAESIGRLESKESRLHREDVEANNRWIKEMKRAARRRTWAKKNGLEDRRARKAWAASNLEIEETNPETLEGVRDCGPKMTATIMAWIETVAK